LPSQDYFVSIGLSHQEAADLHLKYFTQYGLALRGLTRHHDVGKSLAYVSQFASLIVIDPLDFDRECDQALPLEQMISYDEKVRKLFEDIDRSKFRVWALTNAYRIVIHGSLSKRIQLTCLSNQHAERVLRILRLDDLIQGMIYCDYPLKDFLCKPEADFYRMACTSLSHASRSLI